MVTKVTIFFLSSNSPLKTQPNRLPKLHLCTTFYYHRNYYRGDKVNRCTGIVVWKIASGCTESAKVVARRGLVGTEAKTSYNGQYVVNNVGLQMFI